MTMTKLRNHGRVHRHTCVCVCEPLGWLNYSSSIRGQHSTGQEMRMGHYPINWKRWLIPMFGWDNLLPQAARKCLYRYVSLGWSAAFVHYRQVGDTCTCKVGRDPDWGLAGNFWRWRWSSADAYRLVKIGRHRLLELRGLFDSPHFLCWGDLFFDKSYVDWRRV